jgi:hypothetical protein
MFSGTSEFWQGGTATIALAPGSAVPGLLWSATPDGVNALDAYEGPPGLAHEMEVFVTTPDTQEVPANVYFIPEHLFQPVLPSNFYLTYLRAAYNFWGFDPIDLPR